jgi:hypothetical protein
MPTMHNCAQLKMAIPKGFAFAELGTDVSGIEDLPARHEKTHCAELNGGCHHCLPNVSIAIEHTSAV